jgi:hypothetical protein
MRCVQLRDQDSTPRIHMSALLCKCESACCQTNRNYSR